MDGVIMYLYIYDSEPDDDNVLTSIFSVITVTNC